MKNESKERGEMLSALEARIIERAEYVGWRDPHDREKDLAMALLYLGMCMRGLCDTIDERIRP